MNEPEIQAIRWQQRYANCKKALLQLQEAVELSEQRELSKREKQGVIQAFEFTHAEGLLTRKAANARPSRIRNIPIHSQRRQKCLDLRLSHLFGIAHTVE